MSVTIVKVHKAQGIGGRTVPALRLEATAEIPEHRDLAAAAMFHKLEGAAIAATLIEHLAGGTLDQVTVALLQHKASLLAVPHFDPSPSRPSPRGTLPPSPRDGPPVQHTRGPFRAGRPGTVVSDHPVVGGPSGADDVEHYGGYLIAESVAACNVPVLATSTELLAVVREFMRQDVVLRATQSTNIGLANAADHALSAIAKAEGRA